MTNDEPKSSSNDPPIFSTATGIGTFKVLVDSCISVYDTIVDPAMSSKFQGAFP